MIEIQKSQDVFLHSFMKEGYPELQAKIEKLEAWKKNHARREIYAVLSLLCVNVVVLIMQYRIWMGGL